MDMIKIVLKPIEYILMGLVYGYKATVSKMIPNKCRFVPTCSTYMIECIKEWGVMGVGRGVYRIMRCHPHGKTGEDFVPMNPKGDKKWIF